MDNKNIQLQLNKLKELEEKINLLDEEEITDDMNLSFLKEIEEINNTLLNLDRQFTPPDYSGGLNVIFKKLHENAKIPTYAMEGDAGMDLTITEILSETEKDITYGYGIAIAIPRGYLGLILPRSSVRKKDLILSNGIGLIDSAYRGEIMSTFKKFTKSGKSLSLTYSVGDRAAQIVIIPYPKITFVEVDELPGTERGSGGFGHTGQ